MTEQTGLIKYDSMIRAIAVCHDIDEIKEIRDKALAFEKYAQVAMNTDAEYQCAEIRVRAERKAGKLLANMEKAKRGPDKSGQGSQRGTAENKALSDLGISKNQSSKWQQLAALEDEKFEAAISGAGKPSTSGMLKSNGEQSPMHPDALWLWGRICEIKRRDLTIEAEELCSELTELMRDDLRRALPSVIDFFMKLEQEL